MVFKDDSLGKLRLVVLENIPWFTATDIAKILDYSRMKNFLLHVKQENTQLVSNSKCDLGFIEPKSTLINKDGLFEALDKMTGVRSQVADRLKKWIEREIARIKLTQQEQAENLQAVSKRIDTLNGVCIDGTKRQQLVAMVNGYANKAGFTYARGWSDFKEAYNKAFRTNIGLKRKNYMTKNNLQKTPSVPEFLELKGLLDDGIRIADKLLSTVK